MRRNPSIQDRWALGEATKTYYPEAETVTYVYGISATGEGHQWYHCYILRQPHNMASYGIRYGFEIHEYMSPSPLGMLESLKYPGWHRYIYEMFLLALIKKKLVDCEELLTDFVERAG